MKRFQQLFYLLGLCLFAPVELLAQSVNINDKGIAVHGYDVTTYFGDKPELGSTEYSVKHNGATYLFANKDNLARFNEDPAAFLPQYGGYCSFGVRMGKKFDIEVDAYELVDGKLYLMLDRPTHHLWKQAQQENIDIAEQLWPSIKHVSAKDLE